MDSLECDVCLHRYGEDQRELRTLSCGHTLCIVCIPEGRIDSQLVCPFCLEAYDVASASHVRAMSALPEYKETWTKIKKASLSAILALGYSAYFILVLIVHSHLEDDDYWCDGDGMLIILTFLVLMGISYFQVVKPYYGKSLYRLIVQPLIQRFKRVFGHRLVVVLFTCLVSGALLAFLVYDSRQELRRLQSLIGLATLILFGFVFSAAPKKIRWRHVIWGIALQYMLGLLVLKWSVGSAILQCLAGKVTTFLNFTNAGTSFLFGILVTDYEIFAFKVLPVAIFFSSCIEILYYYGAMQWVVLKFGWLLQITIGTTACESVTAAGNIFIGLGEAPFVIRPYVPKLTKSELHCVMTGGFATVAGTTMAAYIAFGIDAASLLCASVMSAPAALAFSKLFYPEVEESQTSAKHIKISKGNESNGLHAAMVGVTNAIPLVANIAAILITFNALIAFGNHLLDWLCVLAGVEDGVCYFENIFGWLFTPLAWVLGVDWAECRNVGELLGLMTIVNEFVAYERLSQLVKNGQLTRRAELIATYALCGFSNLGSVGIELGALAAMAPERKHDIATTIVRAMIAGSCACFLTAAIAGTLLSNPDPGEDLIHNIPSTETPFLEDTGF